MNLRCESRGIEPRRVCGLAKLATVMLKVSTRCCPSTQPYSRTSPDRGKLLRKGDIRVCPETNVELLIRWSEVRVLPPQPISFQRLSRGPRRAVEPMRDV